jgi:hypothetical protein
METFFKFASDSPFLTFFLTLIILQTMVYIAKYVAYAIRGGPKVWEDDDE